MTTIYREMNQGDSASMMDGLRAEARKYSTFEAFEKAFLGEIKHGVYWHITSDKNFRIDPSKGPRDMSSMGNGKEKPGKLMITSHLENWLEEYPEESRPYVALIDMSEVPKEKYWQVNRGFGNEFFVDDPSKAKVIAAMTRKEALAYDEKADAAKPQSSRELRKIWNAEHGVQDANEALVLEVDERMLADMRRRYHTSTGRERAVLKKHIASAEKILAASKNSKHQFGFELRHDPMMNPEPSSFYDETFGVIKPGRYGNGKYVIDDPVPFRGNGQDTHHDLMVDALQNLGFKDIAEDQDAITEIGQESLVMGRKTDNLVVIWGNLDATVAEWIGDLYDDVEVVYQVDPLTNEANFGIKVPSGEIVRWVQEILSKKHITFDRKMEEIPEANTAGDVARLAKNMTDMARVIFGVKMMQTSDVEGKDLVVHCMIVLGGRDKDVGGFSFTIEEDEHDNLEPTLKHHLGEKVDPQLKKMILKSIPMPFVANTVNAYAIVVLGASTEVSALADASFQADVASTLAHEFGHSRDTRRGLEGEDVESYEKKSIAAAMKFKYADMPREVKALIPEIITALEAHRKDIIGFLQSSAKDTPEETKDLRRGFKDPTVGNLGPSINFLMRRFARASINRTFFQLSKQNKRYVIGKVAEWIVRLMETEKIPQRQGWLENTELIEESVSGDYIKALPFTRKKFKDLPRTHQKAIMVYMQDGAWGYDPHSLKDIRKAIREVGDVEFGVGTLKVNDDLRRAIMSTGDPPKGFKTFEDWHRWYLSSNGDSKKKMDSYNEDWPVILGDPKDSHEWGVFQDGWHRFNYRYLRNNAQTVPFVKYLPDVDYPSTFKDEDDLNEAAASSKTRYERLLARRAPPEDRDAEDAAIKAMLAADGNDLLEALDLIPPSSKSPRKTAVVPGVYLTDEIRMARAYANGRVSNAHGGAHRVYDGVIFVVEFTDQFKEIGGDVWQAWASDLRNDAQDYLDDGKVTDSLQSIVDACSMELDEDLANKIVKDPNFLLPHLDTAEWLSIQHRWNGYAELAVDMVPWRRIVAILEYDEDGKLIRQIDGGSSESWEEGDEERDREGFLFHGAPRDHWEEKLKTLDTSKTMDLTENLSGKDTGLPDNLSGKAPGSPDILKGKRTSFPYKMTKRIGDLPDDMIVLIGQFVDSYGRDEDRDRLEDIKLPVVNLPVDGFPTVEMETDDRKIQHALEMDLDKTPPILVAKGEWIDGRHRVYKAIQDGRKTIPAMDLTSILPDFGSGSGDGLGTLKKHARALLEASSSTHRFPWFEQGKPVKDVLKRSDDAASILEDDEWDGEWRECQVPVADLGMTDDIKDYEQFKAKFFSGAKYRDDERYADVAKWMKESGGAEKALMTSPVLVVIEGDTIDMLDGYHRMAVAVFEYGLKSLPALCMERTT